MFKHFTKCSFISFLIYGAVTHSASAQDLEATKVLAEQGDPQAQSLLGIMYDYGLGILEDDDEALKWYRKAADQGHADAQLSLAGVYELGSILPKDDIEAVRWYRKAAEQGHAIAQSSLGIKFREGEGISKG